MASTQSAPSNILQIQIRAYAVRIEPLWASRLQGERLSAGPLGHDWNQ